MQSKDRDKMSDGESKVGDKASHGESKEGDKTDDEGHTGEAGEKAGDGDRKAVGKRACCKAGGKRAGDKIGGKLRKTTAQEFAPRDAVIIALAAWSYCHKVDQSWAAKPSNAARSLC